MRAVLFLATVSSLFLARPASADLLLGYDLNQPPTANYIFNESYSLPGILGEPISAKGLHPTLFSEGGRDGSQFLCLDGWDASGDYSFTRADLSAHDNTFSFDFAFSSDYLGQVTGVSFDWQRFAGNAPNKIQASLFWTDPLGTVQHSTTDVLDLVGVNTWNTVDLTFGSLGSVPIPSGPDISGMQFHVELYAWGGNSGPLFVDNVEVQGSISPVPEPGGVVLMALAGVMLVRARRRVAR
jgi:hypothetical protein